MSQGSEVDNEEPPRQNRCSPSAPKAKPATRKKFSPAESKIVAEAFQHYNGDWQKIMADSRVVETGRDRFNCENHVAYLKRKKNTILCPPTGKRMRAEICEELDSVEVDDLVSERVVVSSSQPASEVTSSLPPLPPLSSLPPLLASIDAVDRALLQTAVSSTSVTNSAQFDEAHARVVQQTEARNSRVLQKTQARASAVEDIRTERLEAKAHRDRHDQISLMMVQLQRDIALDRQQRAERQEKMAAEVHQLLIHREEVHQAFMTRMIQQLDETRKLLLENLRRSTTECVVLFHMFMFTVWLISQVMSFLVLDDMPWSGYEDDMEIIATVHGHVALTNMSGLELGIDVLSRSHTFGLGKGRSIRRKRRKLGHVDVVGRFENDPIQYEKQLFISAEEFDRLFEMLRGPLEKINFRTRLSLQNILLMGLLFMIQYRGGKTLALLFNCSEAMVSKVICNVLPCLAGCLASAIPNRLSATSHSSLHPHIRAIIDNTIHKTRKPMSKQYLDYNGHYKMHGRLTQVVIDFDGNVLHIWTMLPGSVNDALVAVYNEGAKQVLGNDVALGDCAFSSISYAAGGFRSFELNTAGRRLFDKISRREQVFVENINKWIKYCRSINRQDVFIHRDPLLLCCIFAAVGLHNLKKRWGYYKQSRFM